jgi:hypothetical protein
MAGAWRNRSGFAGARGWPRPLNCESVQSSHVASGEEMASLQEASHVVAPGVLADERKGFGLRGEQITSEAGASSGALPGAPQNCCC